MNGLWIIAAIVVIGFVWNRWHSQITPVVANAAAGVGRVASDTLGIIIAAIAAVVVVGLALWLTPGTGVALLVVAALAAIGLGFKMKWLKMAAAIGAALILILGVALWRFPEALTGASRWFASTNATMPRCETFSNVEQRCTFGSGEIVWASTGPVAGLDNCIYPLPPYGDYTLYRDRADAVWYPGMPGTAGAYGFRANHGSFTVTYFHRPWGHCPDHP